MRRMASGVAAGFGATAEVDFRVVATSAHQRRDRGGVLADAAAELVGAGNVDRNGALVMASEDFSYMLNHSPGAYIRRQRRRAGGCQVHNPGTISTMRSCRSVPALRPPGERKLART